ncbi:MAG: sugar ABC transporter permease, partial [Caldilineaceae bacterium]|nr:sugar ABC transporter permease [Caldilineaceae bacterium]
MNAFRFSWPGRVPASRSPLARYRRQLWLLLAPFLAGALLLIGLPALLTFGLAFTRYDALTPPVWSGWANFAAILQSEVFWIAARNTLV